MSVALFAVVHLMTGCASTPQASRERDAEARQFASAPAHATLYIYRSAFDDPDWDTVLWINGKLIGATLPRAFFRVTVEPGKQILSGMGHDNGRFTLETRPGELYFIALSSVSGNSLFWQVSSETGKQAIDRCCALLENWTPGQRPLLR